MDDLKIGVAVMAFGTIADIKDTLGSIGSQDLGAGTALKVMVAHHDDSITEETVRDALGSDDIPVGLVRFAHHDDLNVMRCEALPMIAEALPEHLDWVWAIEEGHSLYSRNAVEQVASTIHEITHANVHLIHASNADRSFDTGYSQIRTVAELCDEFGYFEILGRLSLLLVRPTHFKFAFGKHLLKTATGGRSGDVWITPHTQAQFLYLALSQSDGLLVDLKLVNRDTEDDNATPQGVDGWFQITRELIELNSSFESSRKWAPHFFRYGETSLWSELVMRQGFIAATFRPEMDESSPELLQFIDNWNVLLELADYVDNEEAVEAIYTVVTSGIKLTLDFLKDEKANNAQLGNFFAEQAGASRIYPATLFRADYLMSLLKQSA